jgi:hypothetical protein
MYPHMRVSLFPNIEDECRMLTELSRFNMLPFIGSSHCTTVLSGYELWVNALHFSDLLYFIPSFNRNYPSISLRLSIIALTTQPKAITLFTSLQIVSPTFSTSRK